MLMKFKSYQYSNDCCSWASSSSYRVFTLAILLSWHYTFIIEWPGSFQDQFIYVGLHVVVGLWLVLWGLVLWCVF